MDRRTFLRAAGATAAGAGVAAASTAGAAPASAGPLDVLTYQLLVPEIFKPLPDPPASQQAIVIGSGFGGAVAALRLAQAGVTVSVLERGSRWPRDPQRSVFTSDTAPDGRGFWHRTSFKGVSGFTNSFDDFGGVLDATDYPGIQVWRGAAVGGGSIVYTGVSIEPEQRFFEAVWGSSLSYAEMHGTWYPKARAMLKVSPMPDDVYADSSFSHSRTWDQQVTRAGYTPARVAGIWNWNVVRDEIAGRVRRSATVGESNLGNANGAKYDLTQNYLPLAEATGKARIYPGHQVLDIGRENGRYVVSVRKIDPTGAVLATRTLTCDQLYLAGGSIGSTELLVRARGKGTLPDLVAEVGQGWGTNGDAALVRGLNLGGWTQATPCATRIYDTSGGLPVTLENWYVPGVPVDVGLIGSLGMVLDPTRGSFTYDRATDKVGLSYPGAATTIAALRTVHDRIANASGSFTGFAPLARDVNASFTAHPLGGAVLGRATDSYGRVKGYPGLYVVDGALVPGNTGTVNPSLTIAALAERNLAAIIAAGG